MSRTTTRVALASWLVVASVSVTLGAAPIEYNRDIRPILSENCFQCHGPDSASRKADLRLDKRDMAIEMEAITPGEPDSSELLARINSHERSEVMPPPATKKTLTPAQKDMLLRWIAAGAEYQPHWSFLAPKRPELPSVKATGWVRNPIDRFILAKLEADGLTPAPEADRRTLARRVSLDLTGLPPDPALVAAFVADPAPDAYERLVERLLNSSAWGEHRGRYWLDAARYADTHGIHFDNYREIWAYRDWVIAAFNRNMPFDQFTIEQLAGDLLPNRTLDQQIASGFNRCNITTNEGGAIAEEYSVLYTRDRAETTSQVWLGLTTGCAVCHDHKFDPISQKEFYSLAAFFNNTTQAAMDGNIKNTAPVVLVVPAEQRERMKLLEATLAESKAQAEKRKTDARPAFDAWLAAAKPEAIEALAPDGGRTLLARLNEGTGHAVAVTVDGKPRTIDFAAAAWEPGRLGTPALKTQSGGILEVAEAGDFEKDRGFSYGLWVKVAKTDLGGAILARMDDKNDYRGWDLWLDGGKPAAHVIHKWPTDAIKVIGNKPIKANEWTHLFVTYDGSGSAKGLSLYVNGALQEKSIASDNLKNSIRTEVPLKLAQRHSSARLDDIVVENLEIFGRALTPVEVERIVKTDRASTLVRKPVEQRSDTEKNELYAFWLATLDTPSADLKATIARLEPEIAGLKTNAPVAYVMEERNEMASAFVLYRGEYDKRRDAVKADTPAVLPPLPPDAPRNRLGFARWLLQPDHPLTARVTVNRFWQEVFGTGLVRTAGDFGITGELPSHPELLDWLAVDFRESGWDVKRFFTLIVTSAAYRQSAATTPEKLAKDPSNRLVSRGPRFRMDAEMVRDAALATSGLLRAKLGGPSVRPYQPDGVWEAVAMPGSNTRDYKPDQGDGLYRRSLYTFWKRAAPPASMDIFNAPSREVCTVRRERTNTPLQALVTMNDPQFVEAARHLAETILKQGGETTPGRLGFLAERLLARPLRPEETPIVEASLSDLLAYYSAHLKDAQALIATGASKPDPALDAATLASWTMLSNELMNLDEVLNK